MQKCKLFPIASVSVIIPTYNRISLLEEALASVISQEFDGVIEIIVIDDNSIDGTSKIISQKYPFIHLIVLKQNVGSYVARNLGLLEAKGKYIAFLDSDDLWEPDYLKTQITALDGNERHFAVSAIVIWDTIRDLKRVKLQRPNLAKYASPIHHLLITTFISTPSSVVIPRSTFCEVGLFDEEFRVGGDIDLYLRCLVLGHSIVFTDVPLVIKREHSQIQLTCPENLKTREKSRIRRVEKLKNLSSYEDLNVFLRRTRADIYVYFGSEYLKNNYFLCWLTSIVLVFYYSSPRHGLSAMKGHIRSFLKRSQ